MRPFTQRRGDGPNTIAEAVPVPGEHTEPAIKSSPKTHHVGRDWRPAFEKKKRNLVYSSKVLQDQRSISDGMKMGEAYHERGEDSYNPHGMYCTTSTGKAYYMKAMTPGADFDTPRVEGAQKERTETLECSIRDGEKPGERYLDELFLLRNGVAPCRGRYQRAMTRRKPDTQPGPAAKPSTTRNEMDLDRPESPKEDGSEDGDSGASALTCATDAAHLRPESECDGPSQEEQQQQLSRRSLGSLTDLKQSKSEPAGLEEARSRLEEIKLGLESNKPRLASGSEGEEVNPPESSLKKPQLSLLDFLPLSDGARSRVGKGQSPVDDTGQRHIENKQGQSKSMVRDPGRLGTRRLTAAEKGKWVARCASAESQPRRRKLVQFDPGAMGQAEDGPGLSHEEFVKRMRDQRRRMMEADPRGEGCSSWATAGPGVLAEPVAVGLGMFTNPRPAPRIPPRTPLPVPVSVLVRRREGLLDGRREGGQMIRVYKCDISQPMEQTRHNLFRPAVESPRHGPAAGGPGGLGGHTASVGRKTWRELSKRLAW